MGSVKRSLPVILVTAALLAAVPGAQAAVSYAPTGESVSSNLSTEPTRVAVDEESGNLLVVQSRFDDSYIQVYDRSGPAPIPLTGFGASELAQPYGIAIDRGDGDVYVSDMASNVILRFIREGANSPTYSLDPTYSSPPQGPDAEAGEVGDFKAAIAIDPTNGDLLVADTGNKQVERFDADGEFIDAFDGFGSEGGAFIRLLDIAVSSSGEIYVVRDGSDSDGTMHGSLVERFVPDGSAGELLGEEGVSEARSLALDPKWGNLILGIGGGSSTSPPRLGVLHDGALVDSVALTPAVSIFSMPLGLAVSSSGSLYALTENSGAQSKLIAFDPISIPTLQSVSAISLLGNHLTSVHLAGTVNPLGQPASYRFEYSADRGVSWKPTPTVFAGSGEAAVQVQADPSVATDTTYQARLVIFSGRTRRASSIQGFSTPLTPLAATTGADHFNTTTAIVRGFATPRGLPTSYRFEYGTSKAYSSQTPSVTAGQGSEPLVVAQNLLALQPGTAYHYRLVAESAAGLNAGEDKTFTTSPALHGMRPRIAPAGAPNSGAKSKPRHCRQSPHPRKVKTRPNCKKRHRKHVKQRQGK
jgi:DNA-binding beta-propeller fold protein YncE